jgi:hypothetical protein
MCFSDDLHTTNHKITLWPELNSEIFVKVSYGSCFAVCKNLMNATCWLSEASQVSKQTERSCLHGVEIVTHFLCLSTICNSFLVT